MRQDEGTNWTPTTLKPRELADGKVAVAPLAGTHIFDWNTVVAHRRGATLRFTVEGLPEPQRDGSVAEPLADCVGARDDWNCAVSIVRTLYTQVETAGRQRPLLVFIADDLDTAEAGAVVRAAFATLPGLADAQRCGDAATAARGRLDGLRAAFASGPARMPLVVGRDETRIFVRSIFFNLNFIRGGAAGRHEFDCWSYAATW
jgi:plasmid stabilization system protein ParE